MSTRSRSARRSDATLLLPSLVLLLLLLALLAQGLAGFSALARANGWSLHTYRVLGVTQGMAGALAEMETSLRGFALTGDGRYRGSWRRAAAQFDTEAGAALRLTHDNPAQQTRLRRVRVQQARWSALQAAALNDPRAARARAGEPGGVAQRSALADSMRAELREVQRSELALLRRRDARARVLERRTRGLMLAGGILAMLMAALGAALAIRRTTHLRVANRLLAREAEEHRRTTAVVERLGRQTQLLLDAAHEGIVGVDSAGRTTFLNPAAARLLGYDAESLVGRPWRAVLLADPEAAAQIAAAIAAAQPQGPSPARFRTAEGGAVAVEFACTPVQEEDGAAGAVLTFRDVTERREVERMKDEFISVVSHELRTPLTAIRGSLGLLATGKAGALEEGGRRMLQIAVHNTDRLIRLINDILDLERIESRAVRLEPRPVDAEELVRHALEVMEPEAERTGVRLRLQLTPLAVLADPDRILQVLTNLLSNAFKFSPRESEVEVLVLPEPTPAGSANGALARFGVRDQGRGIPADRLEAIFGRFQQVDSSDSREKGGTGLGLAICHTIITQHGGRIWAESVAGAGSTFWFTLPLASAGLPPLPLPPPSARLASGAAASLLLVEDDADLLGVLSETFQAHGLEVRGALSGDRAWTLAQQRAPDLVVLDIAIPEGDGYWLAERFRRDPRLRDLPIVAYTALDLDAAALERLRRLRVEVLLKSRADPAVLEARVLHLLLAGGEEIAS